jgi:hypothetical protein
MDKFFELLQPLLWKTLQEYSSSQRELQYIDNSPTMSQKWSCVNPPMQFLSDGTPRIHL